MTKSTGERLYRACVRCRQRKTKCDLQYTSEYTHRPCSKCSAEGNRCVPASSRRGGDYSRFRVRRNQAQRYSDSDQRIGSPVGRLVSKERHREDDATREPSDSALGGVQNPLEALQILAQTASSERTMRRKSANHTHDWSQSPLIDEHNDIHDDINHDLPETSPSIVTSELIQDGIVDVQLLAPLLQYYIQNYHPYLPIVPSSLLVPENMDRSWATETFLLAAVLTISTKDRVGLESLHRRILGHMERLILRVVLGATSVRHVGSVEGLLLLAEWVPHVSAGSCTTYDISNYRSSKQQETPDEDSVAWNLIGLAVRQAYLLHLERCSFREAKDESSAVFSRKKLAWFFTYLADRQISIQMGQAFWCRGPGLSSKFIIEDYPSLHPQTPGGINHASFIQAQVELTTMFGNIHDILYASKTRSIQLMLMGDYTKYLDDSSKALSMWKDTFGNVDLPPHLSCLLNLQFEYLRLYVNAFAFQAVLYRPSKSATGSDHGKTQYFPHSVMASPDGRHIYLAIDAAKNVLKKLMEKLNPTKHLRFLPVRFYLYEIHASVFLYKALSVGALTSGEQQSCSVLVRQFISMLKNAATSSSHIASRYGKLLTNLWFQGQVTPDHPPEFTQPRDPAQTFSVNPSTTMSNHMQLSHQDAMEHTEPPPTFTDIFQSSIQAPYDDSTEILGCPDAFLSNLPFLRGSFPDLDENGVGQLLMDL